MKPRILLIFIALFWSLSLSAQQPFLDVSTSKGLNLTFGDGLFSGGVSFADFNLDGWDDLTFTSENGDSIYVYENTGSGFSRIDPAPFGLTAETKEVLWADFDNDGDRDLLVVSMAENILYVNEGSFTFTEYPLPPPAPNLTAPTFGAAFSDVDMDGWLDIFLFQRTANPIPNQYFHNNGDGTFTDLTANYSFNTVYEPTFCGSFLDINGDLKPDLYTAEDKSWANRLFKNNGDNNLVDISAGCGADIIIDAMCVSGGDFDKDGDLDIYVTNTVGGNALLQNGGDETFADIAPAVGVAFYQVGWGSSWIDFDNDTDLDLFMVGANPALPLENRLYVNDNAGGFDLYPYSIDIQSASYSYSCAVGDFNQDGYPDIAIHNEMPFNSTLWQNQMAGHNYLTINLEGTVSNRDGIGSWVETYVGGERLVRFTTCGTGYLAQDSYSQFFGLGSSVVVDSVIVRWPSGMVDKLYDVNANQRILIPEGSTGTQTLPVELISFQGVTLEKENLITWETSAEVDIAQFRLERSKTGRSDWELLARFNAKGSAASGAQYSIADALPLRDAYYRLQTLEFSGSTQQIADIIFLRRNHSDLKIEEILPNPAKDFLQLLFSNDQQENIQINLFNVYGQAVQGVNYQAVDGMNRFDFDLSSLAPGIYFLTLDNGKDKLVEKIVKH